MFEYIQEMREILHNLQNRMQKAKQNIEGISQAMKVCALPGREGSAGARGPGAARPGVAVRPLLPAEGPLPARPVLGPRGGEMLSAQLWGPAPTHSSAERGSLAPTLQPPPGSVAKALICKASCSQFAQRKL